LRRHLNHVVLGVLRNELEHIPARLNRILKVLRISDSWLPY
jgi:hypothetical protein